MPGQGIITKIGYRICDWVGNTIVEPLPHLHQSTWTITAMQMGQPGSISIGTFDIPLYPPRSTEFLQYKGIYSLINYGQRIEAYVIGESGEYINGIPVWSGIIYKIDKELDKYTLSGFDSLWLANQQIFYPGQVYSSTKFTGASGLLDLFNDIETLVFIDDFNTTRYPSYAPAWFGAIGPVWTSTADDFLFGLQSGNTGIEQVTLTTAAKTGTGSGSTIFPGGVADSTVFTAWFHAFNISTVSNNAISCGVIIGSDAASANHWLCECLFLGNGTTFDVLARIWVKAAGVYTNLVSTSAFTAQTNTSMRVQLIVIVGQNNTSDTITLVVNGKDSGCTVATTGHTVEPGPCFGVRMATSGSPTNPRLFMTKYYVKKRAQTWLGVPSDYPQPILPFTDAGGPPAVANDAFVNNLNLNGMNLLDLWSIGSSANGWVWRKDVRRMLVNNTGGFLDSGDPISWGSQGSDIGIDLTSTVTLDEGINIISGGAVANADHIATEIAFGFSPSADGDGRINWPDTPGIINLGQGPNKLAPPIVITDILNITGMSDMLLARRMVEQVGAQKALTVGQAKTFTILRTPELSVPRLDILTTQADTDAVTGLPFQGYCPQAFRELDFVTLNCPSLDIFNAKVSVVGYTFRESDPTFDVVLDQLSVASKQVVDRRRWGNIDIGLLSFAPRT